MEKSINDLDGNDPLRDKPMVTSDPNASSLFYCVDSNGREQSNFATCMGFSERRGRARGVVTSLTIKNKRSMEGIMRLNEEPSSASSSNEHPTSTSLRLASSKR